MKSLVIWGRGLTGKTSWAQSLGNHIYIIGQVSGTAIKGNIAEADYAIFDDIRGGLQYFPAWREWFGCQRIVTVSEKYHEPQQMVWGRPIIWLSNTDPRDEIMMDITERVSEGRRNKAHNDCEWLEANAVIVHLDSKLY